MDTPVVRRTFLKVSAAAGREAALGSVWPRRVAVRADAEPADLRAATGTDRYQGTLKAIEQLGGIGRFVPKGAAVGLL